ncbi:endonuclease domain-containing protein [Parasphingopyxis algicola]|uniref:endonuclease domain-containing protein n=1 Tax=Parasphingopyxis algicola TaxID=2026624 RepID=UPI0015A1BA18|nr:endonuclease domain-containing protein [Parasphingopyxis algicola]QLC25718.1 endonuclease domain-containing protein [Parasphingopyxis algicola]
MKRRPPPGSTRRGAHGEPTDVEKALWHLLGETFAAARFRRQVPIRQYICDFASHRHRIVIEADGGQHGGEDDKQRDAVIQADGYRVIRFWNTDILTNSEGVAERIAECLAERSPHP